MIPGRRQAANGNIVTVYAVEYTGVGGGVISMRGGILDVIYGPVVHLIGRIYSIVVVGIGDSR